MLRAGGNVAAVYSRELFERFEWDRKGVSVGWEHLASNGWAKDLANRRPFNGDQTDLRFLDPSGVVVALKAKGDARGDRSGFVIN